MTSSPNRIIRGANVDGVVFCSPGGNLDEENPQERQEKENLKSLEDFWYQKGLQEGEKKGFEKGFSQGEKEGKRQGLDEGRRLGFEEGNCKGFDEGHREGISFAEKELQDSVEMMKTLTKKFTEKTESLFKDAKPEIIDLTVTLAETLIRRELENTDAFVSLVEEILMQAKPILKDATVDISLSHESMDLIKERIHEIQVSDDGHEKKLHFIPDANIAQGDCKVETSLGMVNFDIKRILEDFQHKALELKEEESVEDDEIFPQKAEEAGEVEEVSEGLSETSDPETIEKEEE